VSGNMIPFRDDRTDEKTFVEIPQGDVHFARRYDEPDNTALASRIAERLIEPWRHGHKIRLAVIGVRDREPEPEVRYDRKRKNAYSVSFPNSEVAAAERWIITALMAGYTVFTERTCTGRGLKDGDDSDDLPPEVFHRLTWSEPLPGWARPREEQPDAQ
jgi:hypothetical protein